jgi:hypothetical protein
MANAIIAIKATAERGDLAAAYRGVAALSAARRAAEIRAQLGRALLAQARA